MQPTRCAIVILALLSMGATECNLGLPRLMNPQECRDPDFLPRFLPLWVLASRSGSPIDLLWCDDIDGYRAVKPLYEGVRIHTLTWDYERPNDFCKGSRDMRCVRESEETVYVHESAHGSCASDRPWCGGTAGFIHDHAMNPPSGVPADLDARWLRWESCPSCTAPFFDDNRGEIIASIGGMCALSFPACVNIAVQRAREIADDPSLALASDYPAWEQVLEWIDRPDNRYACGATTCLDVRELAADGRSVRLFTARVLERRRQNLAARIGWPGFIERLEVCWRVPRVGGGLNTECTVYGFTRDREGRVWSADNVTRLPSEYQWIGPARNVPVCVPLGNGRCMNAAVQDPPTYAPLPCSRESDCWLPPDETCSTRRPNPECWYDRDEDGVEECVIHAW